MSATKNELTNCLAILSRANKDLSLYETTGDKKIL